MDNLIVTASDAKSSARFDGTTEEFKCSPFAVDWCLKTRKVLRLSPQNMEREQRERYTDYLASLLRDYIEANPTVNSWSAFASKPENNKIASLLHQFGVRGEVFGIDSFQAEEAPTSQRSRTNLTFEEFYEMCQIEFHYQGSFGSFKKMIARRYGSFAEYCVTKGYDINGTKWESDDTAIRVAKKLGSLEAVKTRAPTLYNYLLNKGLLESVFELK